MTTDEGIGKGIEVPENGRRTEATAVTGWGPRATCTRRGWTWGASLEGFDLAVWANADEQVLGRTGLGYG